jgi:Flp pilus assembly protein CpaB
MKGRGIAVVVAFVLAAGATLGVFLYVRGVKNENNNTATQLTTVVVAKHDINAGTPLNPLISKGDFTTLQVPNDAIVQGAVTDLTQLQNRTSAALILQNEQISVSRLQGSQTGGGFLGIPAGEEAVTIQLDAQRVLNGVIQTGDHVVVYATSTAATGGSSIRGASAGTGAQNTQGFFPGATLTLVPEVQVLRVLNPSSSGNTGGTTYVTLALKPHDAAAVVAAQAQGYIWLSLLPPDQHGKQQPPVFVGA